MTTTASGSTGDGAEPPASEVLHAAIEELHRAEDAAWQRYAADLQEATHRLDAALAELATRLHPETAPGPSIGHTLATVRGDAEHTLGAARERVQHTIDEVGRAVQDFGRGLRTP